MSDVYIAGTATVFPQPLPAQDVADRFYPTRLCSARTNKLARRVANSFRIDQRTVCIDLERIPAKVLSDRMHHPLAWCLSLVRKLSKLVPMADIGYIGVAYNTTLHTNNLPNLACQIALDCPLVLDIAPEEYANYGCAGGFFPLKSAIQYCTRNKKAAVVIVFDQCNSRASFCYDPNDEMFKMDLKANLLFSDGAAALLLIPERMKYSLAPCLPKVDDFLMQFRLSNIIRFDNKRFILGDGVIDEVPPIVSDIVIGPMLTRHSLAPRDVLEWSIHQGSSDILERFGEPTILGLDDVQLSRSRQLFQQYGNMSAPSCFFVLDSFLTESNGEKYGQRGMLVGFGAGFYLGSLLYIWA